MSSVVNRTATNHSSQNVHAGLMHLRSSQLRRTTVFFFSSRRRHTRFKCDWSSDVCSSDLFRTHFDQAHLVAADRNEFGILSGAPAWAERLRGKRVEHGIGGDVIPCRSGARASANPESRSVARDSGFIAEPVIGRAFARLGGDAPERPWGIALVEIEARPARDRQLGTPRLERIIRKG